MEFDLQIVFPTKLYVRLHKCSLQSCVCVCERWYAKGTPAPLALAWKYAYMYARMVGSLAPISWPHTTFWPQHQPLLPVEPYNLLTNNFLTLLLAELCGNAAEKWNGHLPRQNNNTNKAGGQALSLLAWPHHFRCCCLFAVLVAHSQLLSCSRSEIAGYGTFEAYGQRHYHCNIIIEYKSAPADSQR